MAIDKSILGVAGEFAVASELCRRNVYAQLTLGHQKCVDLLILSKDDRMRRIEVKAKQAREWPACRGIALKESFLVFVDFAGRKDDARPDFYVLTLKDWDELVGKKVAEYQANWPDQRIEIREHYPVWPDQKIKQGQPYKGLGVRVEDVQDHRDKWEKITAVAASVRGEV